MNDSAPTTPAAWFPDPLGRYDHRWFNGTAWTADVSLHGHRYVDPLPLTLPGTGVTATRPSRTMAVLAMISGLAALSTAWMPFFVVIGIIGAVLALVLGVVALRSVAAATADGRGMAIAAIVLAVLALALCPVGIALTRTAYDDLVRFARPGRAVTTIDECAVADGVLSIGGSVTNREDDERDYVLDIAVSSAGADTEHHKVWVRRVSPGARAAWSLTVTSFATEPTCRLAQLTGPYPFGLDPTG